ncbi:hypothetical protein A8990_11644 [Paenibacillus taihuensis]|uniref:Uncharacterized protein n=1 Tax=Paenibacillus taihuensis TaxID=1156355 RepID=A0A3D9S4U0_9BACL|nr:hypothetical protein [Paenibacillus taihuensis]REE83865.1 hypothetical protein A8990_11644 [Paenibacillus taihuensis]
MLIIQKFFAYIQKLWYAPFTIFLIGFIYVQGAFSPFLSEGFFFNKILYVTPASYYLYITNGIMISACITVSLILGHIFVSLLGVIIINQINKINIKWRLMCFTALCLAVLFIILFFQPFILKWNTSIDARLVYSPIYFLLCFVSFLFFQFIQINRLFLQRQIEHPIWILYFCVIAIIVFVTIVYLNGLFSQGQIVNAYRQDKSGLQLMNVTSEDNRQFRLLRFDINTNFIIGYDITVKKMQIIPKDKVKSIETFKTNYQQNKSKYDPTTPHYAGEKQIIAPIDAFYKYRMAKHKDKQDTKQYLSNFTTGYTYNNMNGITGISSNILTSKMNHENYRDKNISEFYGYVCSTPETEQSQKDDAPNVNYRKVYVKEVWLGQTYDLAFTLKSSDKQKWQIDRIEETSFSFNQ